MNRSIKPVLKERGDGKYEFNFGWGRKSRVIHVLTPQEVLDLNYTRGLKGC